eukprot:3521527-Alexandrium_andersonii.AAC.1
MSPCGSLLASGWCGPLAALYGPCLHWFSRRGAALRFHWPSFSSSSCSFLLSHHSRGRCFVSGRRVLVS